MLSVEKVNFKDNKDREDKLAGLRGKVPLDT